MQRLEPITGVRLPATQLISINGRS